MLDNVRHAEDALAGEIWRPIPSLPEYEASSEGRVMRVPFCAPMPQHGGFREYGGKPHFGARRKCGRRFILFRGHNYRIARLVCEAFHGLPPFDDAVAMHIDGDQGNNCAENLKWAPKREIFNTPTFITYCRSRIGENSPTIKGRARLRRS